MYRLTGKGREYKSFVDRRMSMGWHPSLEARVICDIANGRQPLGPALSEAGWYGEEGLTGYLYWLEKFENEGYIEEVEE